LADIWVLFVVKDERIKEADTMIENFLKEGQLEEVFVLKPD